jgi:hypothetical protein
VVNRGVPLPAPHYRWLWLGIWLTLAVTGGCSWILEPPSDDPGARRLVEQAATANADLYSLKGLAQVQVDDKRRRIAGRIAIAAVFPDKIRLEWLSSLGQPLTSFAGNGAIITVVSRGDGKFYRLRQSRTALDTVVHIPIGIEELLSAMAGRPSVPQFEAAQLTAAQNGLVQIALISRWRRTLANLTIEQQQQRVTAMRAFNDDGEWRYAVQWLEWGTCGAYVLPQRVEITVPSGAGLVVTLDRCWTDVEIDPEMFTLAPLQ